MPLSRVGACSTNVERGVICIGVRLRIRYDDSLRPLCTTERAGDGRTTGRAARRAWRGGCGKALAETAKLKSLDAEQVRRITLMQETSERNNRKAKARRQSQTYFLLHGLGLPVDADADADDPLDDELMINGEVVAEDGELRRVHATAGAVWTQHFGALLLLLFVVLPTTSVATLQLLDCVQYAPRGAFVRVDLQLSCDTARHARYRVWAVGAAALYPLGIPSLFAALLWRHRVRINPPAAASGVATARFHEAEAKVLARRDRDAAVAPLRFLWGGYKPRAFLFEVFESARRLALICGLLLVQRRAVRAAVGALIALVSAVVYREVGCPLHSVPFNFTLHRVTHRLGLPRGRMP